MWLSPDKHSKRIENNHNKKILSSRRIVPDSTAHIVVTMRRLHIDYNTGESSTVSSKYMRAPWISDDNLHPSAGSLIMHLIFSGIFITYHQILGCQSGCLVKIIDGMVPNSAGHKYLNVKHAK